MKEVEGYIDHKKMLFLDSLLNARFGDLFEGDELESFHKFLDGSARNAGGVMILTLKNMERIMIFLDLFLNSTKSLFLLRKSGRSILPKRSPKRPLSLRKKK